MKDVKQITMRMKYMEVEIAELEDELLDYKVGSRQWHDVMTAIFDTKANMRLLAWVLED